MKKLILFLGIIFIIGIGTSVEAKKVVLQKECYPPSRWYFENGTWYECQLCVGQNGLYWNCYPYNP